MCIRRFFWRTIPQNPVAILTKYAEGDLYNIVIVTIQNPFPYIRKTVHFMHFLAASQLILLIYGEVTLFELPYQI